jgi:hypothetical protein
MNETPPSRSVTGESPRSAEVVTTYKPWSKWKRRRVHLRWWVADLFHNIGYRIGGDT